jgi:TusA-related sulfurtransferase
MDEFKIDKELNLKGTICPYNFIKTKLAIEEIESGQIIRVIVDFPTAPDDVSRGMEYEGHAILKMNQLNQTDWEIIIKKGNS